MRAGFACRRTPLPQRPCTGGGGQYAQRRQSSVARKGCRLRRHRLLQRAPFVSASAAADALVLVALVVLLELGGIAAVFAAIRMPGFDFARAAFVLALFLHVIDFHLC